MATEKTGDVNLDQLYGLHGGRPLGDMPDYAAKEMFGTTPEKIVEALEKAGLGHYLLDEATSKRQMNMSGTVYAYDPKTLQRELDKNQDMLRRDDWPVEAAAFIKKLAHATAPADSEIFDFISHLHGDYVGNGALRFHAAEELGQGGVQSQRQQIHFVNSKRGALEGDPGAAAVVRRFADYGNRAAIATLGSLYARGIGVKQDYAEAAFWSGLAADPRFSGFSEGEAKPGDIAPHLTQTQQDAVAKRIAAWRPTYRDQPPPPAVVAGPEQAGVVTAWAEALKTASPERGEPKTVLPDWARLAESARTAITADPRASLDLMDLLLRSKDKDTEALKAGLLAVTGQVFAAARDPDWKFQAMAADNLALMLSNGRPPLLVEAQGILATTMRNWTTSDPMAALKDMTRKAGRIYANNPCAEGYLDIYAQVFDAASAQDREAAAEMFRRNKANLKPETPAGKQLALKVSAACYAPPIGVTPAGENGDYGRAEDAPQVPASKSGSAETLRLLLQHFNQQKPSGELAEILAQGQSAFAAEKNGDASLTLAFNRHRVDIGKTPAGGEFVGINKAHVDSFDAYDARAIAALAKTRGWNNINVHGNDAQKGALWLEAQRMGLKVIGFAPAPDSAAALAWAKEQKANAPAPAEAGVGAPAAEKTAASGNRPPAHRPEP